MTSLWSSVSALALVACVAGAGPARALEASAHQLSSPSGELALTFTLEDGAPRYAVTHAGREVVRPSRLGFRLKDAAPLESGFRVADHWERSGGQRLEVEFGRFGMRQQYVDDDNNNDVPPSES